MLIVKNQLAQRIRDARECRDFTQVEMAHYLDVARQTYLDIESGKTDPKISALLQIAELTGRPLAWFLYGEIARNDMELTYRDDLETLASLFHQLPVAARELVLKQAEGLAGYLTNVLDSDAR